MKKIVAILLAAILMLCILSGCVTEAPTTVGAEDTPAQNAEKTPETSDAASTPEDAATDPTKEAADDGVIKVCHSGNFLSHEFQQRMLQGFQYYCQTNGYELTVADANGDIAKQISDIESFIASGADVITVKPVDVNGLDDVIAQCNAKGIPVVTQGEVIEGMTAAGALNHTLDGGAMAQYVYDYFTKSGEKPIILSVNFPELPTIVELENGFLNKLDELGMEYDLYQVNGKGLMETALQQSQDALTAHPDINCVFGINDDSALGAYQAFSAAGIDTSKVLFLTHGIEGNAAGKAIMEDGMNLAGFAMFPEYYAINFVSTAVNAYLGEPYEYFAWYMSFMVDKDNYAEYYHLDADGNYTADMDVVTPLLAEITANAKAEWPDYIPAG